MLNVFCGSTLFDSVPNNFSCSELLSPLSFGSECVDQYFVILNNMVHVLSISYFVHLTWSFNSVLGTRVYFYTCFTVFF